MSEQLAATTHETAPDATSVERDIDITPATDAERAERAELGQRSAEAHAESRVADLHAAKQAVEALFAEQTDRGGNDEHRQQFAAEGLAGLHAEVTKEDSDIEDVYADAKGGVWVVSKNGQQKRYGDVSEANIALGLANPEQANEASNTSEVVAEVAPAADDTIPTVEASIARHAAAREAAEQTTESSPTPGESVGQSETVAAVTETEPTEYTDDTAMADLMSPGPDGEPGLAEHTANQILDIRHNFVSGKNRDPNAFLEPRVIEHLFEKSGLSEDKRDWFAQRVGEVHGHLTSSAPEEVPDKNIQDRELPSESMTRLEQLSETLDQRLGQADEALGNLEVGTEKTIEQVEDLLRAELAKLDRTNSQRLDLVAPYVQRTLDVAADTLARARGADEKTKESYRGVGTTLEAIARDVEAGAEMQELAQQGLRELRNGQNSAMSDTIEQAYRTLRNLRPQHYDTRQDVRNRITSVLAKLSEAREQTGGVRQPRQRNALESISQRIHTVALAEHDQAA